jgi:hypothetical protein
MISVRLASVLAEIQMKHLPNTSLEHYLQTILFNYSADWEGLCSYGT